MSNKYKTYEELKEELGNNYDLFMYEINLQLLMKIDKVIEIVKLCNTKCSKEVIEILRGERMKINKKLIPYGIEKLQQENEHLKEQLKILLEDNNQLEEIRIKAIEILGAENEFSQSN